MSSDEQKRLFAEKMATALEARKTLPFKMSAAALTVLCAVVAAGTALPAGMVVVEIHKIAMLSAAMAFSQPSVFGLLGSMYTANPRYQLYLTSPVKEFANFRNLEFEKVRVPPAFPSRAFTPFLLACTHSARLAQVFWVTDFIAAMAAKVSFAAGIKLTHFDDVYELVGAPVPSPPPHTYIPTSPLNHLPPSHTHLSPAAFVR
jgi:hypothetical protein